jgi:hypothetical protein
MTERTGFNKLLAGLFVIGAVVGLYFQFAWHKFLNNDTLSYINLAERYAEGDWQHAINGFWSPMYSWLLCLCKLAGLPVLQCCYVINFIAAGAGLYVLCKLALPSLTQPLFYCTFCLYALLLMLFYALSSLTPDLMAAVFCLWFLLLVTDKQFVFNNRMQWLAGFVAAGAYFSKLYNFVPMHLFLFTWLAWTYFRNGGARSKLFIPIIKTYGVFVLLSCLWIAILSIHEGQVVVTTAGKFNHNFMSPGYGSLYPTNARLIAPPYEQAYSAHTDPAHLLDEYNWSPFSNARSFIHQLNLIKISVLTLIINLDATGAKWFLLVASLMILFINKKKFEAGYDNGIRKFGWFFICYPLLYLPLFVLDRYVLVAIILFHLLLFFFAQTAWRFVNRKVFMPVIVVLLALSLIPFIKTGHIKITRSTSEYHYYNSFYQHLPQFSFLKDQRIASDSYSMVEATQFCYYYKCRYYSTWTDSQYHSLKQYNIRYLISKQKLLSKLPFLKEKGILRFNNAAVIIYEVQ